MTDQSSMRDGFFQEYAQENQFYDEVFDENGQIRPIYRNIYNMVNQLDQEEFIHLVEEAKTSFFNQGITFAVYSDSVNATEKIFPFDLFPRMIAADEWDHIERGVMQRTIAINRFIQDLYNDRNIIKDKIIPAELVLSSKHYLKEMIGFKPIGGIYAHISGTDIIRHKDGKFYVLEDNLRSPSGVSYVINNRTAMKRSLIRMFDHIRARSVDNYPDQLLDMLETVKPHAVDTPTCVLLTPGSYNSAYYEHTFLALRMGVELVEGQDLFVDNNFVYMKTIHGPVKVDVIYRRIDTNFLDPDVFNPDSLLGVRGLMKAYLTGNVTLVNAPGTGVADDKAVYTYVPDIIKYYLGEEPILNNVRTYRCDQYEDFKYVMDHIEELVVKPVDEAGGYGISIGNRLTAEEVSEVKAQIRANRRKYIAQPIMSLSVHATYIEETQGFEPRHVDLRTYTLLGKEKLHVLKGGLTRVALRKGNLIVNSSQGGGSKDTWVLK